MESILLTLIKILKESKNEDEFIKNVNYSTISIDEMIKFLRKLGIKDLQDAYIILGEKYKDIGEKFFDELTEEEKEKLDLLYRDMGNKNY